MSHQILQRLGGNLDMDDQVKEVNPCIPHPNPPSRLPLHQIPLGLPSTPGLSTCLMHPAWLIHVNV